MPRMSNKCFILKCQDSGAAYKTNQNRLLASCPLKSHNKRSLKTQRNTATITTVSCLQSTNRKPPGKLKLDICQYYYSLSKQKSYKLTIGSKSKYSILDKLLLYSFSIFLEQITRVSQFFDRPRTRFLHTSLLQ